MLVHFHAGMSVPSLQGPLVSDLKARRAGTYITTASPTTVVMIYTFRWVAVSA